MIRPDPDEFRQTFSRHAEEKRNHEFERSEKRIRKEDAVKLEDAENEEFLAAAQAAIEATAESIAAFETKLTDYEALTVEEIMYLQERIDILLEERTELLANAHTLPDGRRVFKTEDGQRVFDEHGVEVDREVVDPNSIGDDKTRWEAISAKTASALQQADRDNLMTRRNFRGSLMVCTNALIRAISQQVN